MFDALHRLLTGVDHPHRAAEQNDSAFALAVLLIEVARSSDNRAGNGFNDARKLYEDTVPGRLDDAALVLGDFGVDEFATMVSEPP